MNEQRTNEPIERYSSPTFFLHWPKPTPVDQEYDQRTWDICFPKIAKLPKSQSEADLLRANMASHLVDYLRAIREIESLRHDGALAIENRSAKPDLILRSLNVGRESITYIIQTKRSLPPDYCMYANLQAIRFLEKQVGMVETIEGQPRSLWRIFLGEDDSHRESNAKKSMSYIRATSGPSGDSDPSGPDKRVRRR